MFATGDSNDNGDLFLTEREPFRYDPKLRGTIRHVVSVGDSLQSIAFRYWASLQLDDIEIPWGPEHLWWILAEFQPDPILDPTQELVPGKTILVPSPRVVQERVLGQGG
jgi:hypothetical protein